MTDEKAIDENNEVEETEETQDEGVPHLVSPLHSISNQIGEHVLTALSHEETVAVLTTVTGSSHGQQVISVPLTAEHMQQVHTLIEEIHQSDEPQRVPCVGFHCCLDNDDETDDD
jgi:hypothetical protein